MTNSIPATIRWLPTAEGGRSELPAGPDYITVVRFEDERDRWPDQAWSLVITFVRPLDATGRVMLTNVRFLADEAPPQFLHAGARFELCEGRRVVAKGVVLSRTVRVPDHIDEFAIALLG